MSTSVRNMTGRTGRPVANQFIITTDQGQFFQSYETVIAFRNRRGVLCLDRDAWDYSTTTGKYRNQFTGFDKAETERRIRSGEIVLANLNDTPRSREQDCECGITETGEWSDTAFDRYGCECPRAIA